MGVRIHSGAVLVDETGLVWESDGIYRRGIPEVDFETCITHKSCGAMGSSYYRVFSKYKLPTIPSAPVTFRLPEQAVMFIGDWEDDGSDAAQIYPLRDEGEPERLMEYMEKQGKDQWKRDKLPADPYDLRLVVPDDDGDEELWDTRSKKLRKYTVLDVPISAISGRWLQAILDDISVHARLFNLGMRIMNGAEGASLALVPYGENDLPVVEQRCAVPRSADVFLVPLVDYEVVTQVRMLGGILEPEEIMAAQYFTDMEWVQECIQKDLKRI